MPENLDWVTGCYEPAVANIAATVADMPVTATPDGIARAILSRLTDINITVEFIDGPPSTTRAV